MLMGLVITVSQSIQEMILEKGLTFVGSSRSGREDFERAVEMLANRRVQSRLKTLFTLMEKFKPFQIFTELLRQI